VTAVFCQSAIDGAQNDHASKVHAILANKEAHLGKINTLFSKFGADDGVITFKMFQEKINSVEVRSWTRIPAALSKLKSSSWVACGFEAKPRQWMSERLSMTSSGS
ncbi:Cacna1h, partial [Symbiodinium sp. KB8]